MKREPLQARPLAVGTRVRLIRVPQPRPRCNSCNRTITAFNYGRGECVVVNRYEGDKWAERLVFHLECYRNQGEPYGKPKPVPKRTGHRIPQAARRGKGPEEWKRRSVPNVEQRKGRP